MRLIMTSVRFFAVSILFFTVTTSTNVATATIGSKCTKAGKTQVVKGVRYVCTTSGGKTVWRKKSVSLIVQPTPLAPSATSTTTSTSTIPLNQDPEITSVNSLLSTQDCRIQDATFNEYSSVSSGFPRPSHIRSGFGQLEVLVIPVSFADLPFTSSDAQALDTAFSKVNSFYLAMSYGVASVKMTLASSSSWVDVGGTLEQNGLINTPPQWDGSGFYRRVVEMYSRNNSTSGYDVIEVVTSSTTRISAGQGMPSGGKSIYGTQKPYSGIQFLGSGSRRWEGQAHEIGHAWLGFEDLYLFKGGTPLGEWDTMSASGSEFNGWSRFLAGWIDSSWVRCASPRSQTRHFLSPLGSSKKEAWPRILVLPLHAFSAVIAELRIPSEWQASVRSPKLVVYRVDTSIDHGNGPIRLIGTIEAKGGTISTDGVRISVAGIDDAGVVINVGP